MRPETAACLADIRRASDVIGEAVGGRSADEFIDDAIRQAAVERYLMTIGEAFVRIRDLEPTIYDRVEDAPKIIGLRNLLAHGYDVVDAHQIWRVATESLPGLRAVIDSLLAEGEGQGL